MRRISHLAVAAALAAGLGVIARAQQQPAPPGPPPDQPIFRSSTRLIVTTVTVKDKDGRPIEGLTAKDFVITEDGQPQDIAFVEFQRLATEAAPALAAAAAPAAAPRPRPRRLRRAGRPEVAAVTQAEFVPPAAGDAQVPRQAPADSLLRPVGDADRRSAARLPGGHQVRDVADDHVGPDGRHDLRGRLGPHQAGLHRRPRRHPQRHRRARLRRGQGRRRRARRAGPVVGLRSGRRRVQHLQHRSPAGGAADAR